MFKNFEKGIKKYDINSNYESLRRRILQIR